MTTTDEPTPRNPFPFLVTARKPTAVALGALAVLFAALAAWWGLAGIGAHRGRADADPKKDAKTKQLPGGFKLPDEKKDEQPEAAGKAASEDYLPAGVWAGLMALLCGGGAFWVGRPPAEGAVAVSPRTEVLAFGAAAGLATALLGLTLAVGWASSLTLWLNKGEKAEAKWVLISQTIFFAGLTAMFVSTQLGRAEQRNNALLRRLTHGFNAAFQGVLVVYVLAGLNLLVFFKVPETFVANDSAFTALADESKKLLRSLDQPVHAYLIMPEKIVPAGKARTNRETFYAHLYPDSRGLLSQAEDQSKFFKAAFLSPLLDQAKIAALYDKLGMKGADRDRYGILLAVGDMADGEEFRGATSFINYFDLIDELPGERQSQVVYQGESKLMSELAYLTDTKAKLAVYFAKGHGELTLEPGGKPDRAMSAVVNFLRDRKLRLETLDLDPANPKIPDDAAMVVVAGPQMTLTPDDPLLAALAEYLKPKSQDKPPGKLLAFLPAFRGVGNKTAPTGLEGLLSELGVETRDGVLVTRPNALPAPPGRVLPQDYLPGLPPESDHPLAAAFGQVIVVDNARPMSLAGAPNPALRVTPVLATPETLATWTEDRAADAGLTWETLRRNRTGPEATAKQYTVAARPLVVAVGAVAPGGSPGEQPKEKPRAVIFASDSLLLDRPAFQFVSPAAHQQIVSDSVDWLREREVSIGIKPRVVPWYKLPKPIEMESKLTLLAMITVALVGLGVGVWYSRRR